MRLTTEEWNKIYYTGVVSWINMSAKAAQSEQYSLDNKAYLKSRTLFLYSYVLSMWQQDAQGNHDQYDNALTPEQLYKIYERVKELV